MVVMLVVFVAHPARVSITNPRSAALLIRSVKFKRARKRFDLFILYTVLA